MQENTTAERRILVAFALNLFFSVLEVMASIFTGSIMIFNDAIHDIGDCVVLGISWRMERYSMRPADRKYPFGYRRFSVLAGLMNSIVLTIGGIFMAISAVERFVDPQPVNGPGMTIFAILGISINGAAMWITSKGNNLNERSICIHMLEDVLTWTTVFIAGIVLCFWNVPMIDSILAILMTILLFVGIGKNLITVCKVLTMRMPISAEEEDAIQNELEMLDGIEEIKVFCPDGERICAILQINHSLNQEDSMEQKRESLTEILENHGILECLVCVGEIQVPQTRIVKPFEKRTKVRRMHEK